MAANKKPRLPHDRRNNIPGSTCPSMDDGDVWLREKFHRFDGEAVESMPSLVASSSMVLLPGY